MHEFTAKLIHEDRMAQLGREADASRLAAEARRGRPNRPLLAGLLAILASVRRPGKTEAPVANLPVRQAVGQQPDDLLLAGREAGGPG